MQTDMHFYGTYSMARAAGIAPPAATLIATAAQFTDDAATKSSILFADGARLDAEATAHHSSSISNINREDQRKVWVPFHFLPGNQGDSYAERLLCRMDSEVAQAMVRRNVHLHEQRYYLPLVGITAHVYADTFSHYGFSGISSLTNRIINSSFVFEELDDATRKYITDKAQKFLQRYQEKTRWTDKVLSWFAENLSGALGHGAAATFPDRPYLVWSFQYEFPSPREERRDNPRTFLAACKALHAMFRRVAELRPDFSADDGRDFSAIEDRIATILSLQANMEGRIEAWQQAAKGGDLFTRSESIPIYAGETWSADLEALDKSGDCNAALALPIFAFYQAAASHRTFVIRELLPSYGMVVG